MGLKKSILIINLETLKSIRLINQVNLIINLKNPNYELKYKNKKNIIKSQKMDQNHKKHKKHKNIQKGISKPILIYMHPNYYFKATINFN